jgi:hypothetical protein
LAKPRRTKQNRRSLDTSIRLAFYETIRVNQALGSVPKTPSRGTVARNVRRSPHVNARFLSGGLLVSCAKDYWYRNATIGSTRIARRAGI